jgi:hypothetical protein
MPPHHAWNPAGFAHAGTPPLTGAHRNLNCAACHGKGNSPRGLGLRGLPSRRLRRNHGSRPCHDRVPARLPERKHHDLARATFDHARFFPIDSGAHAGTWSSCSDCHKTPTNYADFTCLTCHPHSDEAKTSGDHGEVQNYLYESQACYTCHPQGRH